MCPVHPRETVTFTSGFWDRLLMETNVTRITPWLANTKYACTTYDSFRTWALDPTTQKPIALSSLRPFKNPSELFDYFTKPHGDCHAMGTSIPYITGCESRYFVFDTDNHAVLKVCIGLCIDRPYITVEPLVVLPAKLSVYKIVVRIDLLGLVSSWSFDVTRRTASLFEVKSESIPRPPCVGYLVNLCMTFGEYT